MFSGKCSFSHAFSSICQSPAFVLSSFGFDLLTSNNIMRNVVFSISDKDNWFSNTSSMIFDFHIETIYFAKSISGINSSNTYFINVLTMFSILFGPTQCANELHSFTLNKCGDDVVLICCNGHRDLYNRWSRKKEHKKNVAVQTYIYKYELWVRLSSMEHGTQKIPIIDRIFLVIMLLVITHHSQP